jgi:hypothetical protein
VAIVEGWRAARGARMWLAVRMRLAVQMRRSDLGPRYSRDWFVLNSLINESLM